MVAKLSPTLQVKAESLFLPIVYRDVGLCAPYLHPPTNSLQNRPFFMGYFGCSPLFSNGSLSAPDRGRFYLQ